MRRTLLGLIPLALAACGGDSPASAPTSGVVDERKPMLVGDGPLRGVVVSAVRPHAPGEAPEPRAAFATSTTEVFAVVAVAGGLAGATRVRVAWYRLGVAGRRELFAHEIDVGRGGGRVVSQAVAPSGAHEGIYEVVATLGERQVRAPWIVRRDAGARVLSSAAAEPAEPADPAAGTVDWQAVADWYSEADGGQGAYTDDWDEPAAPPGPCSVVELAPYALMMFLDASLEYRGESCATVSIAAAVTGAPRTYASVSDPPSTHATWLKMNEPLCALPGGSDVPGTIVHVYGTAGETQRSVDLTLEQVPGAFDVGIESVPEPGSRVKSGDVIELRAIAADLPPAYGIKLLYVDDGDELLGTARSIGGATTMRPCDHLRFVAVLGDWPAPGGARSSFPALRYRVHADAPPVIEICAHGETFDGRSKSICANYYSGEVWEGTISSVATAVPATGGACGSSVTIAGPVRLVVSPDGVVRGTYDISGPCVSEPHAEFVGTATEDAFHFPQLVVQTNGEPIPKVGDTEARATLTNFQGSGGVGARWVTTWDLKCVTC